MNFVFYYKNLSNTSLERSVQQGGELEAFLSTRISVLSSHSSGSPTSQALEVIRSHSTLSSSGGTTSFSRMLGKTSTVVSEFSQEVSQILHSGRVAQWKLSISFETAVKAPPGPGHQKAIIAGTGVTAPKAVEVKPRQSHRTVGGLSRVGRNQAGATFTELQKNSISS